MRLFANLSLTKKLTAIIMLTTFTALLLSSAAFNVFEIYFSRKSIQNELLGVSEIISSNVAASLVFDDQTTGEEILSALRKDSRVEHARIFDSNGKAFAIYNKDNIKLQITPPDLNLDSVFFSRGKVNLVKPIMLNKERIGTIYIQSETRDMPRRVYTYLGISLLVLFASSIVAFLLSSKLQRLISVPILNLTKTASRISEEKNYALRVPPAKGDEIGRLVESFNDMLANIETRDTALEAAHEELSDNLEQLEKMHKYETIIGSITRSVHQSLDLNEVFENAVGSMYENIDGANHVGIFMVEDNHALLKAYRGLPGWFAERIRKIPYGKGFTWKTIIDGITQYVADAEKDDVIGPAGREAGVKSYISMPINFEGKTIGCISVNALKYNAFDEEVLKLLEIVANQIETAVNNANQAEALSDNLEKLEKMHKYETIIGSITRSVHQSLDLNEVFENAVGSMYENIDVVQQVAIFMVEGKDAVIMAERGHPKWFIEKLRRIPYPKGFVWHVIKSGEPRYCPDVDKDDVIGPAGRDIGIKSYLCRPLKYEGETLGCLNINSHKKNAFDEEELKLLEFVANQIETAVNNANQAEALRESEERYKALFDQSPVGIYIFDKDLKITHCNNTMAAILDSSPDKIIGLDQFTLNDQTFLPVLKGALEGRQSFFEGQYRATTSDANLWLSVQCTPLTDGAGNVIGGLAVVEDITERKQAEEALIESEIRFKRSIMHAPFPIMIHAEDGEVLRINNAWTDITGYSHDDIPTIKDWLLKAYGVQNDHIKSHIDRLFLSNELQRKGEFEIKTSSGQKRIWDFSSAPLGLDHDDRKIVITTAVDITERKRADELIRKSLALVEKKSKHENIINTITRSVHQSIDLNEVLDNAVESLSANIDNTNQVVVFMKEDDFAVIKAQRGFPDWLVGKVQKIPFPKGFTWKVITEGKPIYCSDTDKDDSIGPAGRESGIRSYASMPILIDDETVGCVNLHSYQTDAYDEEVLSLLETVAKQIGVAINNAKQAEALRVTEERLKSVITDLPVFLWAVDSDGLLTLAKGKALESIGRSEESIVGRYFKNVFHDLPSSIAAYEKSLEGQDISAVVEINGSHFECHHSPIMDVDGKVIGVQGLWVDITERKRMEEEMTKHQKLESIGILAGGIAHDFNNLLTAIVGNISLAKTLISPGDSIYKRINEAEKACILAGDLTNQFLTFSKGGAPVTELTSIDRLINDSANFVLRGSNVKAEVTLPGDLWKVEVDKGQFTQVIENLVINARHSMPEGGVVNITAENVVLTEEDRHPFEIATEIYDELGKEVKISITDHGVGISKQDLSKIFDPYFTTKDYRTGLGLSMVYSIIKKHGGNVTVDSTIDKGTTFTIYLPATGKIEQNLSQSAQVLRSEIGKILFMDDDESV